MLKIIIEVKEKDNDLCDVKLLPSKNGNKASINEIITYNNVLNKVSEALKELKNEN